MAILDLTVSQSLNPAAIRSAWKQRIRKVHPDKSQCSSEYATKQAQRLNEAKDVLEAKARLFTRDPVDEEYERQMREEEKKEEEYERQMREEEKKEEEAARQAREEAKKEEEEKRCAEAVRQAREKAQHEKVVRECEEMYNRMKEVRRERYARNRRKRAPGERVHKKIEDYKEGKELVEEMRAFFREGFVDKFNHKLLVRAVMDIFIKSRAGQTSTLELNLFKRHSKRLFQEVWPGVVYSTLGNKRCYLNVSVKH
jgi:hypothetical protein